MLAEKPIYLTEAGRESLTEELHYLQTVKRPDALQRLQDARADGDWMDNAEYLPIEDELGFIDGRIQEIEFTLQHAQIIGPDPDETIVNVGDTVVLRDDDGEVETYTIVGVAESDPDHGLISNESPLARAALNKKVGADIIVQAPAGAIHFQILAIR